MSNIPKDVQIKPYLIPSIDSKVFKPYRPLDYPQLFLEFIEVKQDEEGILDFCNKYGRLLKQGDGFLISENYSYSKNEDEPYYPAWDIRTRELGLDKDNWQFSGLNRIKKNNRVYLKIIGESLSTWIKEINSMRRLVILWKHIQKAELTQKPGVLSKLIKWRPDGQAFGYSPSELEYDNTEVSKVQVDDDTIFLIDNLFSQKESLDIFHEFRFGTSIKPSKFLLLHLLNKQLEKYKYKPKLKWENSTLKSYTYPEDLLSCMWYQFYQSVTGDKQFKKCEICNAWEDVTEASKNWSMHPSCSARLRQRRFHNYNKVDKKELSLRDVVPHFFGKSLDWVKNDYNDWLKKIKK